MLINYPVRIIALVALFSWANSHVFAQEALCPDGKRSYFGVCPEDGNNSRPLEIKPAQKFPACPSNQWFRQWHMCHAREDLGGGLVIDADFVNGAVYDPTIPILQASAYTFIDKFKKDLEIGALNLSGASVFVNFSELIKEGNRRKFKLLLNFDKNHPYMLSKRVGVDSLALPLNVQCKSRTFSIEGNVTGFIGTFANGYALVISDFKNESNHIFKESEIQKTSVENGDAGLQMARVVTNVLDAVCKS